MRRGTFVAIGLVLAAVGVGIRVHNALTFPFLRGYDGFAHFGYIWFLERTGRVPLSTAGWEFFQPPAYYALMVAVWKLLPGVDAIERLRLGTALVGCLGLAPAIAAAMAVERTLPGRRPAALAAAGLVLLLPVHLYSAGFLGNEAFCAGLCGLAFVALWSVLAKETAARAIVLGLVLGAAMLTKFTAVVVVGAAFGTLGLRSLLRGEWTRGARTLALATAAMLLVCGWYYGRNVLLYGNPFQMSRTEVFLSHLENSQLQGRRTLGEYVLFDPLILYRPQWPRGLSLGGERPPGSQYSAMRESIPTGLYANTWFDGFGGFVLPKVTDSEASRRAGQALLTLGMVPTLLMVLGLGSALRDLRRKGWDDTTVAMLLASLAMAAVIVQGTRTVPTQAAVKATYLTPVSAAFAYWFGLGLDRLLSRRPRAGRAALACCMLAGLLSAAVFTHGLLIDNSWMTADGGSPAFRNLEGLIYHAAGDRGHATERFESAARDGWPFAQENLADLALERGDALEALYRLREAEAAKTSEMDTATSNMAAYLRHTLAEYANSRSVMLAALGWNDDALVAARDSRLLEASIPESHYNFGMLQLQQAAGLARGSVRDRLVEEARSAFEQARLLDPAFREAVVMEGVSRIVAGDCSRGADSIRAGWAIDPATPRLYPMETGPGDQNSAGLHRRRRIELVPPELDPAARLASCDGRA